MEKKIANINNLRQSLLYNYDRLQKGVIAPKEAREMSDLAGKVMNSCKLEMSYAKMHGRKKKIQFMEG